MRLVVDEDNKGPDDGDDDDEDDDDDDDDDEDEDEDCSDIVLSCKMIRSILAMYSRTRSVGCLLMLMS